MASEKKAKKLTNQEKLIIADQPNIDSLPVTRRRDYGRLSFAKCKAQEFVSNTGPGGPWILIDPTYSGSLTVSGTQITTSEGHPFRFSHSKGMSDLGGNFYTQKRYVQTNPASRKLDTLSYSPASGQHYRGVYSGPVLAINPNSVAFPSDSVSSDTTLDAIGTTAIAHAKPDNPIGGLLNALVELRREGLPHLFGSSLWEGKVNPLRSLGEENLNYQFGWLPLSSDINDFAHGVVRSNEVINHYRDGIGKPTRRRYDFEPTESTTTTLHGTDRYPWIVCSDPGVTFYTVGPWANSQPGALYSETKVSQKRWFSGAFTYYFPHDKRGKLGDLAVLAHELGLELTPETVWNAAPWSWAVDWFSNVGDVISNYQSFQRDGLVMTYGYVMEHTIVKRTYSLRGNKGPDGRYLRADDVTFVIETKKRRSASPYGFGLDLSALSGFQKAILGSLGLTRIFR